MLSCVRLSDTAARLGLRRVRKKAARTAESDGRLRRLLRRTGRKVERHRSQIGQLRDDLPTLIRLIQAYVRGDYRRLPWRTLALATGALIYFVMPIDLIPDFIVGIGYLDDAAVVSYVLKAIHADLERFANWEEKQ